MKKLFVACAVCVAVVFTAPAFAANGGVNIWGDVSGNDFLVQGAQYEAWTPGVAVYADLGQTLASVGNAGAYASNWVDHSSAPGVAVISTGIYGDASAFFGAAGLSSNNNAAMLTPNAVVMTNGTVDLGVIGVGAATGSTNTTVVIATP